MPTPLSPLSIRVYLTFAQMVEEKQTPPPPPLGSPCMLIGAFPLFGGRNNLTYKKLATGC